MSIVSSLTINDETREIADAKSREDIALLQAQINYIATQLNIDISNIPLQSTNSNNNNN